MFGKVATIREAQVEENRSLEREYIDAQVKMDEMMEIERLKLIRDDEEREARRAAARANHKQVLVDQIQERHQQRQKEQEEKAKDLVQVLQL